jgi:GGDEF domain-containing protein
LNIPVSISVGWAVGEIGIGTSIDDIMKEADNLMYVEKESNRLKYAAIFQERLDQLGQDLFRPAK